MYNAWLDQSSVDPTLEVPVMLSFCFKGAWKQWGRLAEACALGVMPAHIQPSDYSLQEGF